MLRIPNNAINAWRSEMICPIAVPSTKFVISSNSFAWSSFFAPLSFFCNSRYLSSWPITWSIMLIKASIEFLPFFFCASMEPIKSTPCSLPSLPLIFSLSKRSLVSFDVNLARRLTKLFPASSDVPAVTRACWFATNNASNPAIPFKPADFPAAICCGNQRAMSASSKLPAWPAVTALSNTSPIWSSLMSNCCIAEMAIFAKSSVLAPVAVAPFCKVGNNFMAVSAFTAPLASIVSNAPKASSLVPPPISTALFTALFSSALPAIRPAASRSANAVLAVIARDRS